MALVATGFAGFYGMQADIKTKSSDLKSWAVNSKLFFNLDFHHDAIMEAMKASQLLSKTWWKKSIPNDIQQEVKAALFDVVSDSIFVKHTLKGHENWVNSVVFSPDGKTIASASNDTTVKIWDVATGKEIQTLPSERSANKGHENSVNSVVFSPDGKTIASASRATVKIWNWDFKNLLQKGCHRFRHHLADNPEKLEKLQICQNQKTLTVAASTLVRQAEELSKNGDFESAVEKLKKAQQFDANIDLNPKTEELDNDPRVVVGKMSAPYFVTQGIERIYNGDIKEAVAAYNKALQIDPKLEISARNWNRLCWYGGLYNHAKDVMFACKKAVALAPKDGSIIDSRGLARALTGNYKDAIEDFEVSVKWTNNPKRKSQRQSWIKDLQNGKNPFTPEVLEKLRKGE